MKICTKCQESKSLDNYYVGNRRGSTYVYARCKACCKAIRDSSKAYTRDWELKNKYGISLDEYQEQVAKRDSRCDICYQQGTLHVDHHHTTGVVRGYLCGSCNRGIGLLKDSTEILRYAINYLEKHE